jgi:hypothetical protein
MRRSPLGLLLLLVTLAACGGGGGAAPAAGPASTAGARVRAAFPPHGIVDTIEIDATDRLALRAAVLIAPDGSATPASYLSTDAAPNLATGQWAATNAWQEPVTGNDALASLTENAMAGAAVQADTQLLATVSTADIPLPDPVAYRRDWQHYRIHLTFGTPPGVVETAEIAAPAPPTAAAQSE